MPVEFVDHLAHRHAFDEVDVDRLARLLGDDRQGVRIPLGQLLALGDLGIVVDQQARAVWHAMLGALALVGIDQDQLGVAAHHDRNALAVHHDVAVAHLDRAVVAGLDVRLLRATLGGAADVEGTHGELGARLADRLRGDDAHRLADVDLRAAGQIAAVALAADADLGLAGQHRADTQLLDAGLVDLLDADFVDQLARLDDQVAVQRIDDVVERRAAENALAERLDDVAAVDDRAHREATSGSAILLDDDAVLRHVDQAAGQVTRVRRLERGVGQALAGAVGRVEVLEHRQAFLEVRQDGRLDDLARGLGHQAAHAGELLHLRGRAARAGVGHHPHRVDGLARQRRRNALHHLLGDAIGATRPGVDDLVVLLARGDQAVLVLLLVLLHFLRRRRDQLDLGLRDDEVVLAERDAGPARVVEAEAHQAIGEDHRLLLAAVAIDQIDDVLQVLLRQKTIDQRERQVLVLRQDLREQDAARRGLDDLGHRRDHFRALLSVHATGIGALLEDLEARLDLAVHRDRARVQRMLDFADLGEQRAFADLAVALERDVVDAEHDVLRRHDDRLAGRGREDVVGRHHQHAGLELGFQRQRHVDRHLVTVEVGVEGRADQRMQLDRLALDQHRLEGLDAEAMERRRAVQQHGMLADDLLEDVPHLGAFLLDHALGGLDGVGHAVVLQARVDERLEQLERHLLGQAALVQLQFRTDHDDRTARVVDALAEQVLAEAALLALQHVAERLQRALVGAGDDAATAAVVEQGVDRLLQHALLVAHDDVGRAQLDQPLEAVVAVDDAAIEVVQVRRGEAAAVERHQRAQLGRDHRHQLEDHPFGTGAQLDEVLAELQALHQLLALGLRRRLAQLLAQTRALLVEVDDLQHGADRLGADVGTEGVVTVFVERVEVLVLVQKLAVLERRQAGLGHHVVLEVEDLLEIAQRHVEQQADAARQRLQEPDVGNRRGELDVAHALAAHLGEGDLDAALLAGDTAELHALVLAAQALVVLDRSEDARAEQAVTLRLERAVVDGLRLLDLAVAPGADALGAGDRDADLVEGRSALRLAQYVDKVGHFWVLLDRGQNSRRGLRRPRSAAPGAVTRPPR